MPIAAQPAALTEALVLAALRDCYHPELSENIVALGMIENVALTPDLAAPGAGIPGVPQRYRVRIKLIPPPTANEATNSQIAAIIANRLAAFETVSVTDVVLLDDPRWTPDRMSPEARATMEQRIAAPKQNAAPKHGLIQIK